MPAFDHCVIPVESPGLRHNTLPILHQVRHALARLAESGERTVIDLQAIPFGPGDEEQLLRVLGQGEVSAEIRALGPTRVSETAYAGVWLVDYRDSEEARLALQIEVAEIPDILKSPVEDVAEAAERLSQRLREWG
jgi:hydrogenase-1 operon protein HyaF